MKVDDLYEMALPDQELKSKYFYHGCSKEERGKQILQHGIMPQQIEGRSLRGKLTPVVNKVYLTSDISYALIYVLGANMIGEKIPDNLIQKDDGIYYQSGTYSQKEDSWLITHNKILECVDVASKLKVPFIGWLYLINSNIVYQFNITDSHGKYLFEFDVKNTKTQK